MLMTICAAIFALVVPFAMYYCSMYLMYLFWNNKYARKTREEAIEALINIEKILCKYDV